MPSRFSIDGVTFLTPSNIREYWESPYSKLFPYTLKQCVRKNWPKICRIAESEIFFKTIEDMNDIIEKSKGQSPEEKIAESDNFRLEALCRYLDGANKDLIMDDTKETIMYSPYLWKLAREKRKDN